MIDPESFMKVLVVEVGETGSEVEVLFKSIFGVKEGRQPGYFVLAI